MSSISKTLAPALRIGWLVAPPALAAATRHQKLADDRGTPVITQLGLAVVLERGELDRHVRSTRLVYRRRRDALIDALAAAAGAGPHGAAAGLHLLVDLPADLDEARSSRAAQSAASASTASPRTRPARAARP